MRNITFITRISLLIIFLVGAHFSANTQVSLVSNFSEDFSNLNTSQTTVLQRHQNSGLFSSIKRINLADLSTVLSDGNVRVSLPLEECGDVDFKTKSIEYSSSNDYTWYGMMVPKDTCDCVGGDALLYRQGSVTNGYIHIEDRFYAIEPLGEGAYILAQHGPHPEWELGCYDEPDSLTNELVEDRGPGDYCVVRVQFILTENAVAKMGSDYQLKVATQLYRANQILRNSQIVESALKYVLAGIEVVEGNLLGENSTNTVNDIRHDFEVSLISDPNNNWVKDLEQETDFDIAILLVDYQLIDGSRTANSGSRASCLISSHINDNTYTFEHEISHLLGAEHETCEAPFIGFLCIAGEPPGRSPYPARAYPFYKCKKEKEKNKRHTVTFSALTNKVIPYYSNPNIQYNGKAIGTVEFENNSLRITNRACVVADYFDSDPSGIFFPVIEGGDYGVCEYRLATFTAVIAGDGIGPFSYAWQISTDGGITFSGVLSTEHILNEYVGATTDYEGSYFVLKLSVTKQGVTQTVFKTVQVINQSDPVCGGINRPVRSRDVSQTISAIFPNPACTNEINILFSNITGESNVGYRVFDNLGFVIDESWNHALSPDQNTIKISLLGLNPGVYFCEIYYNGVMNSTQKVVIF